MQAEIKLKEKEAYNLQRQLDDARNQIIVQEQVIAEAGAQEAMARALLEQQRKEQTSTAEDIEQEQTREMFHDIQKKLSQLTSLEKCEKQIAEMRNQQVKTVQRLQEAKRLEKVAN